MSTKPCTRPEWLAAGLLCALLSGCPQLASDEFAKTEEPHHSAIDSGGNGGTGGTGGTEGTGGTGSHGGMSSTTLRIDFSTASSASVGGSSTTNTAQGGGTVDASAVGGSGGSGGSGGDTNTDTSSSTGAPPECMEEAESCDGLDNDCDDEVDEEDGTCEDGCQGFALEGHGYMFCGTLMGTSEATVVCSEHGLALVQIDSADENNALVEAVKPLFDELAETSKEQPAFWTGASDDVTEGDWTWVGSGDDFWTGEGDGEPVGDAFENWDEEKPNSANTIPENCAVVYLTGEGPDGAPLDGALGTWNDLPCDDPYTFVCETE